MFEDSTFETNATIHTRSRDWMFAAFFFNASILLALVLFPLIFPQALPHPFIAYLMDMPTASSAPHPPHVPAQAAPAGTQAIANPFAAPRAIPVSIVTDSGPAEFTHLEIPGHELATGVPGATGPALPGNSAAPIVRTEPAGPMRISAALVEGRLLAETAPSYPVIARATHTEGAVVLEAIISKTGAIENLRVVSGPPLLRQAAVDAVKTWRYLPYLLDGQPVEVETTVNVNFKLE